MKKILFIVSLLAFSFAAHAQLRDVKARIKQRIIDKKNQKINTTADNAVDSVFSKTERKASEVVKGKSNNSKSKDNNTIDTENEIENKKTMNNERADATVHLADLTVYKKFDFVAGDKIIAVEDFSNDAPGDFPDRWNTNSTGELVEVEGKTGKWLMLQKHGLFLPEFISLLPDNFTFEFELICNRELGFYSAAFFFDIVSLKSQKNYTDWKHYSYENRNGIEILFHPTNANNGAGTTEFKVFENGKEISQNQIYTKQFHAITNNHVKISVWRQKQRIRVYMNEEKVWDIPKALTATEKYNSIIFAVGNSAKTSDQYYLGNLKLAVGAPDARNKLLKEGKFITRGILFDVNSDVIRPQSYGSLKEIAMVLKENPELNVKVVGHTDSDGDARSNLDLSKRRAESVKAMLVNEFNLDGSRLQTDGKGEDLPIDKNPTPEGKANNRRVEFIKL